MVRSLATALHKDASGHSSASSIRAQSAPWVRQCSRIKSTLTHHAIPVAMHHGFNMAAKSMVPSLIQNQPPTTVVQIGLSNGIHDTGNVRMALSVQIPMCNDIPDPTRFLYRVGMRQIVSRHSPFLVRQDGCCWHLLSWPLAKAANPYWLFLQYSL